MSGNLDAVFAAVADPTRRWLLTRLLDGGPQSATGLALRLPMSRQAVVHHLQALADADLVGSRREGREVRWSATTSPLAAAAEWLKTTAAAPPAG